MLTVVRVRAGVTEHGLFPGRHFVFLGVVRQKPTRCIVMEFGTGMVGDFPADLFEVVPKEEVP